MHFSTTEVTEEHRGLRTIILETFDIISLFSILDFPLCEPLCPLWLKTGPQLLRRPPNAIRRSAPHAKLTAPTTFPTRPGLPMKNSAYVLLSIALVMLSWGAYGNLLNTGTRGDG